jgi:hypothetical protein
MRRQHRAEGSRRSERTPERCLPPVREQHLRGGIHVRSQLDSALREVYESRRIILIVASIRRKNRTCRKFIPGDENTGMPSGCLGFENLAWYSEFPTWTLMRMRAFFVLASWSSRIER